MAGVKGRSGGARAGAGRPPKEPPQIDVHDTTGDPLKFLEGLMDDPSADPRMRLDAAKALMPFKYQKLGEGGKKEKRQGDAEKAASRFRSAEAPKLVAAGGKKV